MIYLLNMLFFHGKLLNYQRIKSVTSDQPNDYPLLMVNLIQPPVRLDHTLMDQVLVRYYIVGVLWPKKERQNYIDTLLDSAPYCWWYTIHVVYQIGSTCSVLYHHSTTILPPWLWLKSSCLQAFLQQHFWWFNSLNYV